MTRLLHLGVGSLKKMVRLLYWGWCPIEHEGAVPRDEGLLEDDEVAVPGGGCPIEDDEASVPGAGTLWKMKLLCQGVGALKKTTGLMYLGVEPCGRRQDCCAWGPGLCRR
jgi:hypothetical protein